MKKTLIALFAGILAVSMLTACNNQGTGTNSSAQSTQSTVTTDTSESTSSSTTGTTSSTSGSTATTPEHNHVAVGGWERNATEHWQVCEDGEKIDAAAHTINEENVCIGCGSHFMYWDDNAVTVYNEDSHGETVRYTQYNADGNVEYEEINHITYDDNGNKIFQKTYENGILTAEFHYGINANGVYITKASYYEEFGLSSYYEYNEFEEAVLTCFYDENGEETNHIVYEYQTDADGNIYMSKYTEHDYANGYIYLEEYNDHGEPVSYCLRDTEGNDLYCEIYEYAVDENGDCYESKVTTYDYESEVIYIGEYNAFGDQICNKIFDLDENLILEFSWEYTYNDDGEKETVKDEKKEY